MQEIEVKFHFEPLDIIANKLTQLGAHLDIPRTHEHNIRYENANGTLQESGIVLRLRQDNQTRFTYKAPGVIQNGIISRTEAEVAVSDFDTMHFILEQLGYRKNMIYEKYRTTYLLDDAEIVLDELPYGNFVEIEASPPQIESIMKQLDVQSVTRLPYSYSRIFDYVKSHIGLSFTDLTFENFTGITVPPHTYLPLEE